ncbi:superoxide dismutase [Fe] 3, chloroplastic-like isoform X2 [Coffea arabica]|uniref:superoxide dismutase n=1 Tax=Coffea arabica TaxID=13443 RepID=A0ABM4VXJ9_COFAR
MSWSAFCSSGSNLVPKTTEALNPLNRPNKHHYLNGRQRTNLYQKNHRASKVLAYYGLRSPPYKLVWNHDFFWESMQPGGVSSPILGLLQQIEKDFGSFTNFREKFIDAALKLFGSGWVWLVLKREEKRLAIVKTSNAVNPLVWNDIPILNLDMWEHAYYLDYKYDKAKYANVFMNHLVSWNAAMARMARAQAFVNLGEPKIPVA